MGDRRVALIRGLNVGRARRLSMADLCAVASGLGLGDVRTVLASGNVVFTDVAARTCRELAELLQAAVSIAVGAETMVTVLSAATLTGVVQANPLLPLMNNPSRLLVAVPRAPGGCDALAGLAGRDWSPDSVAIGSRAAYVWCPHGVRASRALVAVERALGSAVTSRNWSTILKLQALVQPDR